jgi:two-component system sensor histidine kinase DesK
MQISQGQRTRIKASKAVRPGGTPPADEGIASSGITFRLWRLYQRFWLLCLLFPLISLVREPLAGWHLALGLFSLLFFAISYTWLTWPHPVTQRRPTRMPSRLSLLLLVVLCVQVTVFSLLDGPAWLWLFICVSALAGVLLPMRTAGVVVVLVTVLPLAITVVTHRGVAGIDWWWLIALMLLMRGLGLDMIGVLRLGSAIRELHAARRELARLAVIEERERLSRDLHDLLGQTLSMIALKSELARQLVTEEPGRCARGLSEIEAAARRTLREVREAVTGYRQPDLRSELEGARQLLSAAGIEGEIDSLQEALPPAIDAALAWTVREGVTNVIRHSRAWRCRIHLTYEHTMIGVEVLSDGVRREHLEGAARPGLGLAGLRERVSALGGHLEAGALTLAGKEHFRLCVELPLSADGEAAMFQEERA